MTVDTHFDLLRHIILNNGCTTAMLASATGMTAETIQRELQELTQNNYIDYEKDRVMVSLAGRDEFLGTYEQRFKTIRELPKIQRWAMRFEGTRQLIDNTLEKLTAANPEELECDLLIAKLETLIPRTVKSVKELSSLVNHFDNYKNRIMAALDMYDESDDTIYLLGEEVDSFKTVWKQMVREVDLLIGGF